MNKKLKARICTLEKEFKSFQNTMCMLEYLRETNFVGKITHKKLLDRLREQSDDSRHFMYAFLQVRMSYAERVRHCKLLDADIICKLYEEIQELEKEQEIYDKLKQDKK